MLIGYIRFIKSGPTVKAQEAALASVGLDVKSAVAPVYRDGPAKKRDKVKFPELGEMLRVLQAGDSVLISEPSVLSDRADNIRKVLLAIDAAKATLRVVSTGHAYGAKSKRGRDEFMAAAHVQRRQRMGRHASKARTPDKMGSRPPTLKKGTARYAAAEAAWANQKLSQAEAAKIAGVNISTLFRKFGPKGTPRGRPEVKQKLKARKGGKK